MDTDDLRDRIADLRRLRDAASPLPWVCDTHRECSPDDDDDLWYATGPVHVRRYSGPVSVEAARREVLADMAYLQAAANLAPALADAYEQATAETQRVADLYRELAAAICAPTTVCEDHRILLLEAAKHRGEWQSLCVAAKDATIAERDAEIVRLKAALEPFARTANGVPDNWQGWCGLTFVVSSYPSKQTGNRYIYVQSIGGDNVDIDIPTIADWRAAADALKGANRDE